MCNGHEFDKCFATELCQLLVAPLWILNLISNSESIKFEIIHFISLEHTFSLKMHVIAQQIWYCTICSALQTNWQHCYNVASRMTLTRASNYERDRGGPLPIRGSSQRRIQGCIAEGAAMQHTSFRIHFSYFPHFSFSVF